MPRISVLMHYTLHEDLRHIKIAVMHWHGPLRHTIPMSFIRDLQSVSIFTRPTVRGLKLLCTFRVTGIRQHSKFL